MSLEEGVHDGEITAAHIDIHEDDGMPVLHFNVKLANGAIVSPRHRTGGDWGRIGCDVAKALMGDDWLGRLEEIDETVGKSCQVKIKYKAGNKPGQMFENAYIHIERKQADEDQVAAGIAKLRASKDDNTPF